MMILSKNQYYILLWINRIWEPGVFLQFKKWKILVILMVIPILHYGQPANPWSPPEFYPSKAVILEWDSNEIWPLYSELYLELISEIKTEAEVILVVKNQNEENAFTGYLNNANITLDNISFVHIPGGRIWIRDHGPLAVKTDNGVAFIDFDDFANSYESEALPTHLANLWGLDSYKLDHIILDGGNFMVDSYGNLFATDRLYSNNPGYTQQYIDNLLEEYMGIQSIYTFSQMGSSDVWGHIDMQMKLLDDTTVVISSVQSGWSDYQVLEDNTTAFSQLTAPSGKPYRIGRLPKADNWKTYTNSLIVNNKVIIPVYNHPNDQIAISVYQDLLPDHQIVGINSNAIVGWDGVIHCITMQLFDDQYTAGGNALYRRDKAFQIYPNPANEIMEIQSGKTEYEIELTDLFGQVLFKDKNSKILNVSPYSPGTYLLLLKSEGLTELHKVIIF